MGSRVEAVKSGLTPGVEGRASWVAHHICLLALAGGGWWFDEEKREGHSSQNFVVDGEIDTGFAVG